MTYKHHDCEERMCGYTIRRYHAIARTTHRNRVMAKLKNRRIRVR